MKCPADGTDLVMTDRSGVEIDYCPQCRGVWLDRGELDKIIDRATPAAAPVALQEPARRDEPRRDDYRRDEGRRDYGDRPREYRDDDDYRKRRKKSVLGELFDF